MAIKVDFTQDDMTERSFEPMPNGNYKAAITGFEVKEVSNPTSANVGKPMFAIEATVQEGDYINRKVWFNVMLFPVGQSNTMWFLAAFLKACGFNNALETGHISDDVDDYLGKDITLKVVKKRDTYRESQLGDDFDGEPIYRNEVNGFVVDDKAILAKKPKKASLAP